MALVHRKLPNGAKGARGRRATSLPTALPVCPICTLQRAGVSRGIRESFVWHRGRYRLTHPGQLGYAQMASKQVSRNLVSYQKEQRLPGKSASTPRLRHGNAHLAQRACSDCGGDHRAHAGTMVDNDNNKRRRLVEFKDGCRYGKFGKTKAYELIAHERIRAYKMGGKTMIDLDSVDEYHTSLPRVETRAS